MIFNLLEAGIMALIFGGILFIIVVTIKSSKCQTKEEKSEVANHQKSLFIKCFVIAFVLF